MCGTTGCVGENASFFVYHELLQLQHRGEDTTKILSFDNRHYEHGGIGRVSDIFDKDNLSKLKGSYSIGQVRYPTVGLSDDAEEKLRDAPPIWTEYPCFIGLSHNGDMPKTAYANLRKKLEDRFYFKTNSDLEIIEKLFSKGLRKNLLDKELNNDDIFKAVKFMMERAPAAYAATGIVAKGNERRLIGFTDPQKIRPLVFAKNSKLQLFASETAAIDVLNDYLNEDFETYELQGGEVIIAEEGKEPAIKRLIEVEPKHCFFEYTYFARPDSIENGVSIREVRYKLGQTLGRKNKAKVEFVTNTPDSGRIYDEGFSKATGIPNIQVWYKNTYMGRAFTRPITIRENVSKIKLNPIRHLVDGRKFASTEDSIVRGTNSSNDVEKLKRHGAKEVHGKIGTPPLVDICESGIDMKNLDAFIAKGKTEEEIAKLIGYASLSYSTVDEVIEAIGLPKNHLCLKCIGGHGPEKYFSKYIIPFDDSRF